MKTPDEAPCNQKTRMVIEALIKDGYDLNGVQFFKEDIAEIDRLYCELAHNQLAEFRIKRVIEAAKHYRVAAHHLAEPGDAEEPKDCWAVKLFGQVHAFEKHHSDAVRKVIKQRQTYWVPAGIM